MTSEQRIEAMDKRLTQINNLIELYLQQNGSGLGIEHANHSQILLPQRAVQAHRMITPYQPQASAVNFTATVNGPSTSKQVTAPVKRAGVQLKTTAGIKAPRTVENKLTNQRGDRNSMILFTDSEEKQEQNDSHSKGYQ